MRGNKNFEGKKLLILGAAHQHCKIIRAAQELGAYVIVTDYLENSPGKKIADKNYMFSINDIEGIVAMCKEEKIDGVLHGYIDPCQRPYYEICTRLGLPCLGTWEQYFTMTDKHAFKKYCIEHDVDVIPELSEELFVSQKEPEGVDYPVFVKPVDSRGSRGQAVCNSADEVRAAIDNAKKESSTGDILIEKYLGGCDEFQVTYFFIDGKPYLHRTADRYLGDIKLGMEKVGICTVSPSKHTELYLEKVHERVRDMFVSLGIQNGPVFMQGLVDGDKIRFFDPGLRFPGSDFENLYKQVYDIDIMKMLVEFAFTGKISNAVLPEDGYRINGNAIALLFTTVKPGKITEILGMDEIMALSDVVANFPKYYVGDTVPAVYNVNQRFNEMDIISDSVVSLRNTIEFIYKNLKVLDSNGDNLLFAEMDVSLLKDSNYTVVKGEEIMKDKILVRGGVLRLNSFRKVSAVCLYDWRRAA